ncbi:hypothetical protein [Natrinema sp. 1APR25-10V2]|uniref:hypothetical protein n=1 Tax=Natrinema sp. 1APR25-10V2 TaxID=2951081 RepID=UPI002876792B|nr:hypothetical protein [Natrinema sp. 1APR25-10V2]MDS0477973.1 hypothetical protein [Natrinema sp. 1APR25-10V2]
MPYRGRSIGAGRHRLRVHQRIDTLESELETTKEHVRRLENTLQAVVRNADDVSIGGPCSCGESFLFVRDRELYCPQCGYQRTI